MAPDDDDQYIFKKKTKVGADRALVAFGAPHERESASADRRRRVSFQYMKKVIQITTHEKQAEDDKRFWQAQTPEYRLDALERLRLEAGNFLYEYPARLQRVISVTRKESS